MKKNLKTAGLVIGAAGLVINLVDTATAASGGGPEAGLFYGTNGYLRSVNDKLPISVGLLMILAGAGTYLYAKYGR